MNNNNQSNRLVKLCVIAGDFFVLWLLLYLCVDLIPGAEKWTYEKKVTFWMLSNIALLIAEIRFPTIIDHWQVGADAILKRITMLTGTQTLLFYLMLRAVHFMARIGWQVLLMGLLLWGILVLIRLGERLLVKRLRRLGYNSRTITLVGNNQGLQQLTEKLLHNPTLGYRVCGRYDNPAAFAAQLDSPDHLQLGDELYLCVSRLESTIINRTLQLCNQRMVKFYYVPPVEENLNLQPVFIDDIEVMTPYISPLDDSLNRFLKRLFDIITSIVALVFTALLFPFVCIIIKIQSPGPVFFRQRRTGLAGHEFYCYKFRSMHVNADSDSRQATKDDPRKFPFGNFIRKTNIDELPQFWNVLCGDMSIVGPRPHMLSHTEQYSHLIGEYMVRHFVKPGVTGWAQVTGFRGETSELWQMEGRVERDIWYIQHWTFWLDIRIIWMTIKTIFHRDANAY